MNTEEEILFERGSNPSLRRANRAAKQQGNQRASQPTNPLFNVATIINHLGYLYFCISLWDSRHIQAIGAKFSSLSIYIYIHTRRRFYNAAGAAGVYPIPWLPSRAPHSLSFSPPPFSRPRAPGFSRISEPETRRPTTPPPPPPLARDVACQPTFIFAPVFHPFHPFDPLVLAELLQLRERCVGATGFLFQRK